MPPTAIQLSPAARRPARRAAPLLALTLLLAAGGRPAAGATAAGAVPGSFSVGPDGNAVYQIALATPPGIGGVEPGLALAYASQAANGIVGVGWQLQGLSGISRCAPIRAVDGFVAPISYGPGDRFCLDGQRLINVAGDYGADGSVYRTELETWRKVVANGRTAGGETCGSGPCSFTVTLRDGSTWTYGGTEDSRVRAIGRPDVRVWALSETRDLHGNYARLSYTLAPVAGADAADGQYYPARIDYTGNATTGFGPRFSVRFVYETRPDAAAAWLGGSVVRTAARLRSVGTFLDETPLGRWDLAYDRGTATGRSRLVAIAECGLEGGAELCLPPTRVAWQDSEVGFDDGPELATGAAAAALATWPMDVDGDGRGDLVQAWSRTGELVLTTWLAEGDGFAAGVDTPTASSPTAIAFWPMDVDGDGRGDLVQAWSLQGALQLTIRRGLADGRFADGGTVDTGESATAIAFWPMDADADGRTDLVQARDRGGLLDLVLYLADAAGFAPGRTTATGWPAAALAILPMDVDADARVDLVQVSALSGRVRLAAFLSRGVDFAPAVETVLEQGTAHLAFLPLDANADGSTDLVQAWSGADSRLHLTVALARGDGSFAPGVDSDTGVSAQGLGLWPMDVVGDGTTELVQAGASDGELELLIFRPAGDRFLPPLVSPTGSGASHLAFFPMDVQGDGKADLVQAWSPDGVLRLQPYLSIGPFPDLAAAFTDGIGGRVLVEYAPLTDPAVYQPDPIAPQFPNAEGLQYVQRLTPAQYPIEIVAGGPTRVVAAVTQENAPEVNPAAYRYRITYGYAAAELDVGGGRGWLGYEAVTRLDPESGQRQVRTFNQAFPRTGTVAALELLCDPSPADPRCPAPGTPLGGATLAYDEVVTATGTTAPNPRVYQVLRREALARIDAYGAPGVRLRRTWDYDPYGDPIRASSWGEVDEQGADRQVTDDVHTCSRYDQDPERWRFGRLARSKVSSRPDCDDFDPAAFRPGIDFSLERWEHDPANGDLLETAAWDDQNRVELVRRSTDYDAYGHPRRLTDPAGGTADLVWEEGFHTYVDRIDFPADPGAPRLSVRYGFDPRFGTAVAATGPNGETTVTCLDALGRPVASQGPPPDGPSPPSDPNCAPTLTTGSGGFRSARVLTFAESATVTDALGVYGVTRTLQRWPAAGTPPSARDTAAAWTFVDGLGRTYKSVGERPGADVATCTVFDRKGRATRRSLPFFASGLGVDCGAASAAVPFWITAAYDIYDRPVEAGWPAGEVGERRGVARLAYPTATRTEVTWAPGTAEEFRKVLEHRWFDDQKQVVRMILPGHGGDGDATTVFEYDALGRQTAVTDPRTADNPEGVTTRTTRDSLGRTIAVDDPDQNTTGDPTVMAMRYLYGTDGRLRETVDAAGQRTVYAYDALGRPVTVSLADGRTIRNTWDDPAVPGGLGRLTRAEVLEGGTVRSSLDYAYDPAGRPRRSALAVPGAGTFETLAFYDPPGGVERLVYPDGSTLSRLSEQRLLRSVALDGRTVVEYLDYDPLGKPRQVAFGNGVATTYAYSPTGEMLRQTVERPEGGAPGDRRLLDRRLVWTDLGELAGVMDELAPGFSWTYGYRNRRLATAVRQGSAPRSLAFGYDASGNLTSRDGVDYTYRAHRMVRGRQGEATVFEADYDANGNTSERRVTPPGGAAERWRFAWDPGDRLAAVEKDGVPLFELAYDATGRRLQKVRTEAGETTTKLYAGPGYRLVSLPGGEVEVRKLLPGLAGAVAVVTSTRPPAAGGGMPSAEPTTLYLTTDHLGSTSIVTDASGTPETTLSYLPWGELDGATTTAPPTFEGPTYEGRERDDASGLYDFGARPYAAAAGRFLAPDDQLGGRPLQQDAWNRFAFALNSPVVYTDPTGHSVLDSLVGSLLGGLEIAAGVALDAVSGGTLAEGAGGALIGAGFGAIAYSATHSGGFSWEQYGVATGTGAAVGLVTAGLGEVVAAGAELAEGAAVDVLGDVVADAGEDLALDGGEQAAADLGEDVAAEGAGDAVEDDLGSCPSSFAAGTPVVTATGPVPIERVAVGDLVVAADPETGEVVLRPVVQRFERVAHALVTVELAGEARVSATPGHPFWREGEGWTEAVDLSPGDLVRALDGVAVVTAIEIAGGAAGVYNLEVEEVHSYHVSSRGALVHNALCARERREASATLRAQFDADQPNLKRNYGGGHKVSYVYEPRRGRMFWAVSGSEDANSSGVIRDAIGRSQQRTRAAGEDLVNAVDRVGVRSCGEVGACLRAGTGGVDWENAVIATFDIDTGDALWPCRGSCQRWIYNFISRDQTLRPW